MLLSVIKQLCLTGIIIFVCSPKVFSQNYLPNAAYIRPLSLSDSLLVHRYIDSVNTAPMFTRKRQKYYDSALMIKPWKANWWQQKGMMLMKQKKYEAGMRFLDSAVKYDCKKYIDYRGFMKCIFQKSYQSAIEDFELAKVVVGAGEVMDHTYDFYIGLSYMQLDELDSAIAFLTRTTEAQMHAMGDGYVHPLDLFYLGVAYYENEDYTNAIVALDSSLALYKNFSDAEYYKAICLKMIGKNEQAITTLTSAESDFKQGYTINEDNVIHEVYPCQIIEQATYDNALKWVKTGE